jgi:hypothetical protein
MSLSGITEVPGFLQRWEVSPKEASFELPPKRGHAPVSKFLQRDLENRGFVTSKDKARMKLCKMAGKSKCEGDFQTLETADDYHIVNLFVGETIETNILKLDAYKTGEAQITPWSGHYWPIYEGGIGVRYGDERFPHSESFEVNYKYFKKHYLKASSSIKNLDKLSPSEKYDLISEDKNWSLTKYSWAVGKHYYDATKEVETWMGICHGWAPAAFVVPEPKKSFEVTLPHLNKTIKFYPDDIKALVSQLWAQAEVPVTFIGGRCNDKDPKADDKGRIISRDCFDTNPASWHLTLLNLLGKGKKSFVFDATYDYEVWNQPISSYKLKYFNPNDKQPTEDLVAAVISYGDFKDDPYKKYRSANVKSIVGVQLDLSYVVESMPFQVDGIDASLPNVVDVTYYYDLEIDENNNVIGGEWYQAAHPDMLWKPTITRPLAKYELENSFWDGNFPVPLDILTMAKKNSKFGEPISALIDQLISWSAVKQ